MNDDEHYCPDCGRVDHKCVCDWPQPQPPPYPADDEDDEESKA